MTGIVVKFSIFDLQLSIPFYCHLKGLSSPKLQWCQPLFLYFFTFFKAQISVYIKHHSGECQIYKEITTKTHLCAVYGLHSRKKAHVWTTQNQDLKRWQVRKKKTRNSNYFSIKTLKIPARSINSFEAHRSVFIVSKKFKIFLYSYLFSLLIFFS